jgi:putative transposase
MRELLILAVHLLVTCAKLLRSGGVRAVAAESLLLKHQLLISNRSRQRAPNLTTLDRFVLGLTRLFVNPRRIAGRRLEIEHQHLACSICSSMLFRTAQSLRERTSHLTCPHRGGQPAVAQERHRAR